MYNIVNANNSFQVAYVKVVFIGKCDSSDIVVKFVGTSEHPFSAKFNENSGLQKIFNLVSECNKI